MDNGFSEAQRQYELAEPPEGRTWEEIEEASDAVRIPLFASMELIETADELCPEARLQGLEKIDDENFVGHFVEESELGYEYSALRVYLLDGAWECRREA